MEPEAHKKPDALEKKLERMIRKLDREKQALDKILKVTEQPKSKTK